MIVKFWGVRGSIPCPPSSEEIRSKIRLVLETWLKDSPKTQDPETFLDSLPDWLTGVVGGNTICLEISDAESLMVFDAGTGLRSLGQRLIPSDLYELFDQFLVTERGPFGCQPSPDKEVPLKKLHLFMTHTHWDHIQGFPFFRPAYVPYYQIDIIGSNQKALKAAFEAQQAAPDLFPVPVRFMRAKLNFIDFPASGYQVNKFKIDSFPLPHPGGSLAYRVKSRDKIVVFATDYEIQKLESAPPGWDRTALTDFIKGADVFISDTQYTYLDHATKEGWGHSNALSVVEMAAQAGVKSLYLFHHDPSYSDAKLVDILDKTRAYTQLLKDGARLKIYLAMEGLTLEV
ncbi:MAG: MBL fold metallo-hydrolase [Deltaproteobacteria bacterium]|jgi:phosphoribosyl 1,2-cyclic phosphodiesterase|nr:MBL fold metallo-hydrolase [Deltaproteobacteria bacterium]